MRTSSDLRAIVTHGGLVDRSDRVRLEITGPDRAKFLHNLTTNEIKRLPVGRGCESFVTSPQGKTIGYLIVHAADDRLLARADAGGDVLVLPHLEKYGVFDDVSLEDRSSSTFEFYFLGPHAPLLAERAAGALPEAEYGHLSTEIGGNPVRIIRESLGDCPGFTVIGDKGAAGPVKQILEDLGRDLGLVDLDVAGFDALRIEAGTPVFGKEVTEKNLPQEFGRDDRAISFVKGCYLGQETVARLDALGHVNQILRGFVFDAGSPCPESGSVVEDEGKRVGVITSSAFSPLRNAPVALGLIRTTHCTPGTRVKVGLLDQDKPAEAIVSGLPMTR